MRPPSCARSKWLLQIVQVQGRVFICPSGSRVDLTVSSPKFFSLCWILPSVRDLLLRVSQDHRIGEQSTVNKVIMSDQPRNGGVEVELGAPVALCVEFSSKYVTFLYLKTLRQLH